MSQIITTSAEETKALAGALAQLLYPGSLVSLKGQLGSGKTTFTQGFAKELGIKRAVKSPTYTIVKQYPLEEEGVHFNHIDAYRLEQGGAESVDLDSFIGDSAITVIEWAEFVIDYMPESYIEIELNSLDEERRSINVELVGENPSYEQLITRWIQDWRER